MGSIRWVAFGVSVGGSLLLVLLVLLELGGDVVDLHPLFDGKPLRTILRIVGHEPPVAGAEHVLKHLLRKSIIGEFSWVSFLVCHGFGWRRSE